MNIDKVKGIIVTCLLLLFFWAGQETNATNTTLWQVMKDLITTLCGVATLVVAALALDNWKAQARNSKIDNIVESLTSVEKSKKAFCHSLLAVEMYCDYNAEVWKDHAELFQERYQDLVDQITYHKAKLQLLRRYGDDDSYRELTGLFCQFETNVNLTHEYIKVEYPSMVQGEACSGITFNRFSITNQKALVERSFSRHSSLLYSIQ